MPQHRRVESDTAPLRVVSAAPVERHLDRSVTPGEEVVQQYGAPRTVDVGASHPSTFGRRQTALQLDVGLELRVRAGDHRLRPERRRPEKPGKVKNNAKDGVVAATDGAATDGAATGAPATDAAATNGAPRRQCSDRRHRRLRRRRRSLGSSDRVEQPTRGCASAANVDRVDGAVAGSSRRRIAIPSRVIAYSKRKACAAHVEAPRVEDEPVIEQRRREIAHVRTRARNDSIPSSRSR